MVRREQKIVQPYTEAEIKRLLQALEPANHSGCRMRAMILFLLDTGVRSSELVSIRLDDVFPDQGRVRVMHGEGRKQRWVGISPEAWTTVANYTPGPATVW